MKSSKYCNHKKINLNEDINNIAFDGEYYYFTIENECKIIKTNSLFNIVEEYKTCRVYDCICYDYKECCFWVSSLTACNTIFKLTSNIEELDCIVINLAENLAKRITGISYNCCKDKLVISFENSIIEINKCNKNINKKYKFAHASILSALSLCPGYIVSSIRNRKQFIWIMDSKGNVLDAICFDCSIIIKNIIFNPCNEGEKEDYIEFLVMKKDCCYLDRVKLNLRCLGLKPCSCNYKVCKEECHKEKNSCNDIIESVALEQTALAHILNAEGEKLQKILATTNNVDQIMCVNREVAKTIMKVTQLEYVLYSKLSLILEEGCQTKCDDWKKCCKNKCPKHI